MSRIIYVIVGAGFSGVQIVERVNEPGENHVLTSYYFMDKSR
jgi:hypothetical protein